MVGGDEEEFVVAFVPRDEGLDLLGGLLLACDAELGTVGLMKESEPSEDRSEVQAFGGLTARREVTAFLEERIDLNPLRLVVGVDDGADALGKELAKKKGGIRGEGGLFGREIKGRLGEDLLESGKKGMETAEDAIFGVVDDAERDIFGGRDRGFEVGVSGGEGLKGVLEVVGPRERGSREAFCVVGLHKAKEFVASDHGVGEVKGFGRGHGSILSSARERSQYNPTKDVPRSDIGGQKFLSRRATRIGKILLFPAEDACSL